MASPRSDTCLYTFCKNAHCFFGNQPAILGHFVKSPHTQKPANPNPLIPLAAPTRRCGSPRCPLTRPGSSSCSSPSTTDPWGAAPVGNGSSAGADPWRGGAISSVSSPYLSFLLLAAAAAPCCSPHAYPGATCARAQGAAPNQWSIGRAEVADLR